MLNSRLVESLNTEDDGESLTPLPNVLHHGLAAVAVFGFLSFLSTVSLFSYLTFKLVVWQLQPVPEPIPPCRMTPPDSPSTGDVDGFLVPHARPMSLQDDEPEWQLDQPKHNQGGREPPNQFLVLIYNLLLADIQQAVAFLLNATWLARDAVAVGTDACWAQGWFVSTGDLASSVFIGAIAIHTYLDLVRRYRPSTWTFYSAIIVLWIFVYGMALLGIAITSNGAANGGYYVRAGAWCWINAAYQPLRLYLHYLWIFICLGMTSVIYAIIYCHICFHSDSEHSHCFLGRAHESPATSSLRPGLTSSGGYEHNVSSSSLQTIVAGDVNNKRLSSLPCRARQPAFLLYPIIYVLCTAPLAAGRLASMAGNNVPLSYFCFAGAMIASAGWLDVALYSWTRRSIVFSGETPPGQDTGLGTFSFMRTPAGRRFGNIVYVRGGRPYDKSGRGDKWNNKLVARARLKTLKGTVESRNESNETLGSMRGFGMHEGQVMGMTICKTVTTVVVEEITEAPSSRK